MDMSISSVSSGTTGVVTPVTQDQGGQAATGAGDASVASNSAEDTVTLSAAAQAAANDSATSGTTDTSASTSTVVTTGIWAGLTTTDAFQKNKDTFDTLTSIVLDNTGKYSADDQLSAYKQLWDMNNSGKFYGIDSSGEATLDNVTSNSSVAKLNHKIYNEFDAVFSKVTSESTGEFCQDYLNKFSSLSDYEKNVYFTLTINPTNYLGQNTYSSLEEYESKLVRDAQSSGTSAASISDTSATTSVTGESDAAGSSTSTSSSVVTGSTDAAGEALGSSATTSTLSSADAALQLLQYAKTASDAYTKAQQDSASSATSSVTSATVAVEVSHISLLRTSLLTPDDSASAKTVTA